MSQASERRLWHLLVKSHAQRVEATPIELTGKPVVSLSSTDPPLFLKPPRQLGERIAPFESPHGSVDPLVYLESAAAALMNLAEHADDVPGQPAAIHAIHQF